MKKISEESLPKLMKETFNQFGNWSKVYYILIEEMKSQIKLSPYNSIDSNFGAIFTYELIKSKVSIEDFRETFNYILDLSNEKNVERIFCRYFDRESDEGLLNYIKKDRFNNNFSCWTNMEYIFLDLKGTKGSFKVILEPTTLPYLEAMFSSLKEDKVAAIYGAGVNRFLMKLLGHLEETLPLIKIAEKNPAFKKSESGNYRNFVDMLLNDVSGSSYELSGEENLQRFNTLKENINNFEDICKSNLINYRDGASNVTEKLNIHLSVLNFLISVDMNIFDIINEKYIEKFEAIESEQRKNPVNAKDDLKEYYKSRPYMAVVDEISSSLSVGLKNKDLNIDMTLMDTSLSPIKNYVYLQFMESQVSYGHEVKINSNVMEYIKTHSLTEKYGPNSDLSFHLKWEKLLKYCNYYNLDKSLPEKKSRY